ncbi:MAG TPA: alpha/beta hydrolase [Acidimicrobiales bacterium]|nr:alpha/beta hydrolase [Acidimicrobiales bacterium]
MTELIKPRLEGTVGLGDGRRMGFAEFGHPFGRAIVWLHGTPGARRQIPHEARVLALEAGLRIVGIDRPGIGSSSRHVYPQIGAFADDLESVADALGIGEMVVIGLSGGGPYALSAGARLGDRVAAIGVLGGVAPTRGPDAIDGGLVSVAVRYADVLRWGRVPLGFLLGTVVRAAHPIAAPGLDMYARLSPEGDRRLLARPEFKAMFLDDLINGSRRQLHAPVADAVAFTREWGFHAADVRVPVVWWHGDADHIVRMAHGVHMVSRLPDAELRTLPGESHLAGLGVAEEIVTTLIGVWDERAGAVPA